MGADDRNIEATMAQRTLASLLSGGNSKPTTQLGSIFGSLDPSPTPNRLMQYSSPFEKAPNPQSALADLFSGPAPRSVAETIWPTLPTNREPIKRKVFFSFHYKDVMRVNNVRQQGKIGNRPTTFYDWSLWERKRLEGPDALKRLIRERCKARQLSAS